MTKKRHTPERIVTLLRQGKWPWATVRLRRKPAKRRRLPSRRITAGGKNTGG